MFLLAHAKSILTHDQKLMKINLFFCNLPKTQNESTISQLPIG